uniref:Uncharacterized protein n=1 Tax=Anguilla anguilla TaxID=7936 RepID=A0A0E9TYH2_ANGAN
MKINFNKSRLNLQCH